MLLPQQLHLVKSSLAMFRLKTSRRPGGPLNSNLVSLSLPPKILSQDQSFWSRAGRESLIIYTVLNTVTDIRANIVRLKSKLDKDEDRKILTYFIRICSILVRRIVQSDLIEEAHQRLVEIVKIIEQKYGWDFITPNLHLSLHLHKCAKDFGPLYAFWYFSFERMNGVLGELNFKNACLIFFLLRLNWFIFRFPSE